MKKFNRKDALKYVNKKVNDLSKKGLDIDFLMKGKSPQQYAYSSKSLEQFKKQVKRTIERPKIIEEVQQLNQKRQQFRYAQLLTPKTKSIAKFNLGMKNLFKKKIAKQTKLELMFLKDTYFKELKGTEHEKRINKLIKRFGNRLDLAHEFIDYIAEQEFVYPFEKDVYQKQMASEYFQHMVERLDTFEDYVSKKLRL